MSAKKAASPGRSAAVAVEPPAPSAAARRAAEAELRALVSTHAPTQVRLANAARRWLQARLPTAHEIVYEYRDCYVISYSPNENGYDGVLALRGSAKGIDLYFNQGKGLPDPAKLLRGSGNQVRLITLEAASTLARAEVVTLVDEALARNPVPYARSGTGSIVIRSTAAKQRRTS